MALLRSAQRISYPLLSQAPAWLSSSMCVERAMLRYSTATETGVVDLKSSPQFDYEMEALKESGNLGVLDFTAAWCGPCRSIAPVFDAFSKEFPEVKFYRLDIDAEALRKTVESSGISAVPTFKFVKGGTTLATITGADKTRIRDLLLKHK